MLKKAFAQEDALKAKQSKELNLWHTWNNNGRKPDDLKPLLSSIRPLIMKEANKFRYVEAIPFEAIKAEFTKQAIEGLKKYDPAKAQLNTHLTYSMLKAKRFVTDHQNIAHIPEKRVWKIQEFNTAKQTLDDQLGRPPTTQELSEHLGWSLPEVGRMESEQLKDKPMSGYGEDPITVAPTREGEVLKLIYYELDPEQKSVWEYHTGMFGKPKLSPGQIATKLGMNPSKVSRIRKAIADKIAVYLK